MAGERMRFDVSLWMAAMVVAVLILGCGAGGGDDPSGGAEEPQGAAAEAPARAAATGPSAVDLAGAWLLEDLGGRGVMDRVQTTIEFDGGGGVFGSGGCNRYTGSYTFVDGKLEFGPLAGTKKMCPEAVMDQEDRFLRALGAVERVEMDGPFLLIFHEGSDEPLRFTKIEAEIEL